MNPSMLLYDSGLILGKRTRWSVERAAYRMELVKRFESRYSPTEMQQKQQKQREPT
jgi:hypothetical protein